MAEAVLVDRRPVARVQAPCRGVGGRPCWCSSPGRSSPLSPGFCRRAQVRGIFAYGKLAGAVGRRFERRWLDRHGALGDEVLSAPDFSATTDLYQVAANVGAMRLVPFSVRILIPLVVATLLPFLPIVLAILPLKELLNMAAKLVL